jgi:hypothetical protein
MDDFLAYFSSPIVDVVGADEAALLPPAVADVFAVTVKVDDFCPTEDFVNGPPEFADVFTATLVTAWLCPIDDDVTELFDTDVAGLAGTVVADVLNVVFVIVGAAEDETGRVPTAGAFVTFTLFTCVPALVKDVFETDCIAGLVTGIFEDFAKLLGL